MENHFPLPPLSQLYPSRRAELDVLIPLISKNEMVSKTAVLSAFSIILGQTRSEIWNSLLSIVFTKKTDDMVAVIRVMLRSFIAMSLFVQ